MSEHRKDQPEYTVWQGMKQRCFNPKAANYKNYGGRGITIDPAWLDYDNFLRDMGPRRYDWFTIERLDNNGPYCKSNCIWADRMVQRANARNTKLNVHLANEIRKLRRDQRLTHKELAARTGVSKSTIGLVLQGKLWT